MNLGIVGHAADKFTPTTEKAAKEIIRNLLSTLGPGDALVSGGCHLGGIDIWAEEIADELGLRKIIHHPRKLQWSGGYRERNLKIAKDSDTVVCIVVKKHPPGFKGRRFTYCYHCNTFDHVKSGGCWTAKKNNVAVWYEIAPDGEFIVKKEIKDD